MTIMSAEASTVIEYLDGLPATQATDHALFGEVEYINLPRAQQIGGQFLARNWVSIPHVTHHDDVDITDLEILRQELSSTEGKAKVTMPVLLVKAIIEVLRQFPKFNASLDSTGKRLCLKHYFNIGLAVDTPNGLLVPVIKNADKKRVDEIAVEFRELALAARTKGLPMSAMEGGSFTLSSIGNLGGTAFTPIINAPEVAILGATKAYWKPERGTDDQLSWRLKLPLSLSYDHRVINGADAARFLTAFDAVVRDAHSLVAPQQ
ncbi:MAG: 2-oxo acid dehydrogenase subunit E2 [Pseudomonadota bacterium]